MLIVRILHPPVCATLDPLGRSGDCPEARPPHPLRRHLLSVSGRNDTLFSTGAIEGAASQVRRIYQAAGHPRRYEHRWGAGGHRFYKDLMWPFVQAALGPGQAG